MRARWLMIAMSLIFVGTLAVIVGWRLSSEAMAVLVGVAVGVFASVPTSLLIVWVTLRQVRAEREQGVQPHAAPQSPQVVVVAPGMPQGARQPHWSNAYAPSMAPLPVAPPRRFSVIGGEQGWEEDAMLSDARRVVEDIWQS